MKNHIFVWVMMVTLCCTGSVQAIHSAELPGEKSMTSFTVGDMLTMKVKEFQSSTGRKLSFKEKIGYGLVKGQLKKAVRKGQVSVSADAAPVLAAAEGSFNFGAFLLGLLLGLLGFLIVVLAFNDKKAWRWALIGWAVWLVLYVALVL